MQYDATTTKIFEMPPYAFFAVIGVVFASSLFILLLFKYGYSIRIYSKIFWLSGIGLLVGAKLFGCLTGLYGALGNNEPITLDVFLNTGIVFYGGLIGFITSFLLICKIRFKKIDYNLVDLAVVCIPLFHFFGRLGCFFAGCCFGIETDSWFSVLYTTYVKEEIITARRVPIQLVESSLNLVIFFIIFILLSKEKFRGNLLKVYLFMYATMRFILEFFRGDVVRGIWNGISFSQVVSVCILMICFATFFKKKEA